jgi:hypothetical protein
MLHMAAFIAAWSRPIPPQNGHINIYGVDITFTALVTVYVPDKVTKQWVVCVHCSPFYQTVSSPPFPMPTTST